jgi:prophage regulatory protein
VTAPVNGQVEMRLVRSDVVFRRYSMSRTKVWRDVRDGRFPAPVKLGSRTLFWKESDLLEWEKGLTR